MPEEIINKKCKDMKTFTKKTQNKAELCIQLTQSPLPKCRWDALRRHSTTTDRHTPRLPWQHCSQVTSKLAWRRQSCYRCLNGKKIQKMYLQGCCKKAAVKHSQYFHLIYFCLLFHIYPLLYQETWKVLISHSNLEHLQGTSKQMNEIWSRSSPKCFEDNMYNLF